VTESPPPPNDRNPGPTPNSWGQQAWQRALEQDEVEWRERSRMADEVSANSPDKQPFDPKDLATVYPLGLANLSERVLEGYRTQYYLDFPGKTLAAYGQYLQDYDAHDSN
jgi:hypothetical protein